MDDKQALNHIAVMLLGIHENDLSTAEKRIVAILTAKRIVRIDEFASIVVWYDF